MIGQRVRDQLFAKDENPLGEDITINGISFQIIGVFQFDCRRATSSRKRNGSIFRTTRCAMPSTRSAGSAVS